MAFLSTTLRNLAFTSRQLSRLLESDDADTALQKLRKAGGPAYAADVGRLQALLDPQQVQRPSAPGPYAVLAKLMPEVGAAKSRFFRDFVDYVRHNNVVLSTWWTGLAGLVWYLVVLCSMAVLISGGFALSVLPSFEQLFSQMGGRMPAFTERVFMLGSIGLPVLALVAVAVIGLAAWFALLFRTRIRRFAPLPRWPVPIFGTLAETWNYGLFVNFARLLLRSDVPLSRAVDIAARHANQPSSVAFESLIAKEYAGDDRLQLRELAVSAKLGNLASELDVQCDEHLLRLADDLVAVRDRFGLFVKLVLYFLIACLIVAMYLPIFKMGSVVGTG